MNNPNQLIFDLDFIELMALVKSWDEPEYRALQIWEGLYQQLWDKPEKFTNLSIKLRDRLGQNFIFSNLNPSSILESHDGQTTKTLFILPGDDAVETVLMHYSKRQTLCISTQAGCAMGCVFCATGQMGFRRNLTSGEIVEQVLFFARKLKGIGERLTNIVIMGMGEPFHNYDATMKAIDRLNNHAGYNFGERRFTISTVGLVPAIRRFTQEKRQINLAISLHAADNKLRSSLLPINKKYPLEELFDACWQYVEETRRRISFEWALIKGVNDSVDQANQLAQKLQIFRKEGIALCHVNVIPLNSTIRYSGKATPHNQAALFKAELERFNIPCTIRIRRGIDIQAGCGQLADERKS